MDSYNVFSTSAHVNWDKSNPNSKENEDAEGDELRLIKIIRQLSCHKGQHKAHASQDSNVSKNKPEANFWTSRTFNDDCRAVVVLIVIGMRWTDKQPNKTDNNLKTKDRKT